MKTAKIFNSFPVGPRGLRSISKSKSMVPDRLRLVRALSLMVRELWADLYPKFWLLAPRGRGNFLKNKPISGSDRSYPEEEFGTLLGSLALLPKKF